MSLLAKNLAVNVVYYAITVVALPAAVLAVDESHPSRIGRAAGAIAIAAGAALQLW